MTSIEQVLFTPHIISNIFAFTTLKESCVAREVCQCWASVLSKVAIFTIPDWYGTGPRVDADRLIHVVPIFSGDVQSITASMKIKDQGWGNRKGRVWFVLCIPATLVANPVATHYPFEYADHEWRTDSVEIKSNSEFIQKAVKGTFIQVWLSVGGGGGHELRTKDFKLTVRYKPSTFSSNSISATNSTFSNCTLM